MESHVVSSQRDEAATVTGRLGPADAAPADRAPADARATDAVSASSAPRADGAATDSGPADAAATHDLQAGPASADAASAGANTAGAPGSVQSPSLSPGQKNPWKVAEGGKTVFRRNAPVVIAWIWVIFAVFNVFDVVIPGHDYFSLELLAGLLTVTGVAYASGLRPKVVADSDGVFVRNPYRDHRLQWGAITGVYLGDSVELSCLTEAPKKEKTIYCWSLFSSRRSHMRSQMQRSMFTVRRPDRQPQSSAADVARHDLVPVMAEELGRRATEARTLGAAPAVLESRWARLPLAVTLLPAVALLVLLLAK
jgi:Bacterial PH domain